MDPVDGALEGVGDEVASAHAPHLQMALRAVATRLEAALALRGGPARCRLVAVSKTKPAAAVRDAFAAGQRHFGENYVQELVAKAADPLLRQLGLDDNGWRAEAGTGGAASDEAGASAAASAAAGVGAAATRGPVRWHFIGSLQSNKCRVLIGGVPGLFMVESVDSAKLATLLDKAVAAFDAEVAASVDALTVAEAPRHRLFPGPLRVLVQVNTSDEPQKGGCAAGAGESSALARHIADNCPHLSFRGLMTIGRLGEGEAAPCFARLARERDEVASALGVAAGALELSMGMSGDFERAVGGGSTSVRVGSSIFGSRA